MQTKQLIAGAAVAAVLAMTGPAYAGVLGGAAGAFGGGLGGGLGGAAGGFGGMAGGAGDFATQGAFDDTTPSANVHPHKAVALPQQANVDSASAAAGNLGKDGASGAVSSMTNAAAQSRPATDQATQTPPAHSPSSASGDRAPAGANAAPRQRPAPPALNAQGNAHGGTSNTFGNDQSLNAGADAAASGSGSVDAGNAGGSGSAGATGNGSVN